jgi:hypothetical protein
MKTLSCAVILLLCYVFPAHAQAVATNCATPPSTFNSVWYIDPVHGATTAAGGTGSKTHPWNSLEAVFLGGQTGYTYPLLTTAPYRYWPAGQPGFVFQPGPGAGPIKPGDEILLMSGNYGDIWIGNPNSEISNSSFLTIAAAPGQTPVLTSLFVHSTNMLQFNGLKVQSLAPATLSGNWLVEVKDQGAPFPTSDIVFENMTISSQDDVSAWTQAQWLANARNGFSTVTSAGATGSKCISITGSHITNVRFGALLEAGASLFSGNEIDHFGDDGLDYAASNLAITKNYIHDAINVGDGNHPDAMQGVIGVIAPGVAANTYESILIDSNKIIRQVDPHLPWPTSLLQGIDAFNSDWINLTVTNNVVITSSCNGIVYSSLQGGLIANNTVLNDGLLATPGGCKPVIAVGPTTSGGSPSKLVAVRNNLASAISIDNLLVGVEADHNVGIDTGGAVFAWAVNGVEQFYGSPGTYGNANVIEAGGTKAEFVNFDPPTYTYNVMLLKAAPAIGVGATGGPTVDILGVTRSSPCPCAGAYGYPD